MDEIRKTGPTKTPDAVKKAGLSIDDLDFANTHNSTQILVDEWRKALGMRENKIHTTYIECSKPS